MTELEYKDLPEKVSVVLKEMILRGDLAAGQKLVQEELAARLGVSRTPLLSALTKLEKELLVEIIPRRGAFVRKISLKELKDIYDIRVHLEPLGAFKAAELATEEEIAGLESIASEFYREVDDGGQRRIPELDYRFHMMIHRMSGNEFLFRMIGSYSLVVLCNINRFVLDPRISRKDHEELLEAIRKRDAARAGERMRLHLEQSRRLLDSLEEEGTADNRGSHG
jgi:DNA-binding GntR family transcriptional regulator